MRHIIAAVWLFLALLALSHVTEGQRTYSVLWQFQRENGQKLIGQALRDAIALPVLMSGDMVRFYWNEGTLHSVYNVTSEADFNACALKGSRIGGLTRPVVTADFTVTLRGGTHYFFDDAGTNCKDLGLGIIITVLPDGVTTAAPTTTTTIPPAVGEPAKSNNTALEVTWHFGRVQPDLQIQADDFIRFRWSDSGVRHTLRQVDLQAYTACNTTAPAIREWSEPTSPGDVLVSGLQVGLQYFICYMPTHCSSGSMKLRVNVVPANTVYEVTVWPISGSTNTSRASFITLTGSDAQKRVWVSPERIMNQRANPSNPLEGILLPMSGLSSSTFQVRARDVGTITALRVRVSQGENFRVQRIRVRRVDALTQSTTFECSPRALDVNGTEIPEQWCIVPVEPPASNISAPTRNTSVSDCNCFREFLMDTENERVLTCTTDGCFATMDSGRAGWSDIPSLFRLLGIGNDSAIYGLNLANTTVASRDGGVTWRTVSQVPSLARRALNYTFDVQNLTTRPLDQHIFRARDGTTEWGVSSQGVHTNSNGVWDLRALWSCSCDGACGLKCNQ